MWCVVKVIKNGPVRILSRHRTQENARKAATKLRCQSGVGKLRVTREDWVKSEGEVVCRRCGDNLDPWEESFCLKCSYSDDAPNP